MLMSTVFRSGTDDRRESRKSKRFLLTSVLFVFIFSTEVLYRSIELFLFAVFFTWSQSRLGPITDCSQVVPLLLDQ